VHASLAAIWQVNRIEEAAMAKLRHFALSVPDVEAAAAFYEKAFGLQRVGESDHKGAQGVYLSDGTINLALLRYKNEEAAGGDPHAYGVHHFGFVVDDVQATIKDIEAAGGTYLMGEEANPGAFYEIKYRDPNGAIFDITANGWRTEVEPAKDAAE
jgi:predicted enzyme related to lactoylglutathione lyase